jgi:CheY-like chemotaxis protein/predicted ester cyclase
MRGWILVADHDVEDGMLLFRLLERDGHRATVVGDSSEALALLRAEPFDVLLADAGVPGVGALETIRAMKADPGLRHIPVIVTTVAPETTNLTRCLALGAEGYLRKPVDLVLLRATVAAALAKKRLRDLEAGYEGRIRQLADAVASIGRGSFVADELERLAAGSDPFGHLARALLQATAHAERRERDQVTSFRGRQFKGAGNSERQEHELPTRREDEVGASEEVVRKKIEAFNSHDPEQLRPLYSPGVQQQVSGSVVAEGFDEMAAFFQEMMWDPFPDFTISLERVVEQGDVAFVEGRAVGTHTGPLREPGGDIPPTGRGVDFAWADCYEIEDGRIVASHLYFDTLAVLGQLGLAPEPAHT